MALEFKSDPDANKSFVQNYYDHLSFFYKTSNGTNIPSVTEKNGVLLHIPIPLKPIVRPFGRFNVHKALHDRYDYMDEVLGATVAPIVCVFASIYLFVKAMANLWTFVLINSNSEHGITKQMYLRATIGNFCYAIFALIIAIYCLLKSIASLLIRPLLTMINGYDTEEENRFCIGDENSIRYISTRLGDNDTNFGCILESEWHTEIRPKLGF